MNCEALQNQCQQLLLNNQKIQAIKLWREHTGHSLKEAKGAIEEFEGTGKWSTPPFSAPTKDQHAQRISVSNEAQSQELPPEAIALLTSGRKVEAIKVLRQERGCSLSEAKLLVEQLESNSRAEDPGPPASLEPPLDDSEVSHPPSQQGFGIGYWLVVLVLCGYLFYLWN